MEGHLQHPDEMTWLNQMSDFFWCAGFAVAMVLIFRTGITFRYAFIFAMSVGFLLIADPRNIGGILIYPVTAACALFAMAVLMGWID